MLRVADLTVEFPINGRAVPVVNGVSFEVRRGEAVGIVGESGSGKSVTVRALMGLIQRPGRVTAGSVMWEGVELLKQSQRDMRARRGAELAMIFQDPMRSLNPTMKIGSQIVEAIRAHDRRMPVRAAKDKAVELLEAVQIPAASQRADEYAHQLSGGMRQRVMIAMALSGDPRLLIADEPTTALDVTVQAQILELIANLQEERGMAVILVTHDLGVASQYTDSISVMYAGRVVERAPTGELFRHPRMPYTRALMAAVPRIDLPPHSGLAAIPGHPPHPGAMPSGCPFHPRCPRATVECVESMPAMDGDAGHGWACWHPFEEGEAVHGR